MQNVNSRLIKAVFLIIFFISIAIGSYYWGYLCGKQKVDFMVYDQLLIDLSNNILIRDALEVKKAEQIEPLVVSTIESDFAYMIQLYETYKIENSEYVRCTVSRKMRDLKEKGLVMSDKDRMIDFPIAHVNTYLEEYCLGESSHANWIETEK